MRRSRPRRETSWPTASRTWSPISSEGILLRLARPERVDRCWWRLKILARSVSGHRKKLLQKSSILKVPLGSNLSLENPTRRQFHLLSKLQKCEWDVCCKKVLPFASILSMQKSYLFFATGWVRWVSSDCPTR